MATSTQYRVLVVLAAAPVMLARVEVSGIYQLGGTTASVVWRTASAPDIDGGSPVLGSGAVHLVHLQAGAQLWVRTALTALANTPAGLWLVWPDEQA